MQICKLVASVLCLILFVVVVVVLLPCSIVVESEFEFELCSCFRLRFCLAKREAKRERLSMTNGVCCCSAGFGQMMRQVAGRSRLGSAAIGQSVGQWHDEVHRRSISIFFSSFRLFNLSFRRSVFSRRVSKISPPSSGRPATSSWPLIVIIASQVEWSSLRPLAFLVAQRERQKCTFGNVTNLAASSAPPNCSDVVAYLFN